MESEKVLTRLNNMEKDELITTTQKLLLKCRELQDKLKKSEEGTGLILFLFLFSIFILKFFLNFLNLEKLQEQNNLKNIQINELLSSNTSMELKIKELNEELLRNNHSLNQIKIQGNNSFIIFFYYFFFLMF